MAFSVSIQFLAVDKFSKSVAKMARSMGILEKKTKKAKKAAEENAFSFKRFAIGLISVATLMKAFSVSTRFEGRLLEVSAITGAVGKDMDFLKSSAFELGKAMAFSGEETLEAFKLVASAKPELLKNLPALKSVTKEVLTLANAAGLDLATAANITAQGLNIFGEGADQASRFVNVLAAGAKYGASEIQDTGAALLIAGPAARAAGLTFEQLNAAIQTTALGGIKAERAGTALNSIFIKLQKAGFDLRKQKLEDVFGIVEGALNKQKSAAARTQLAIKLFGEEHIKVAEALIANKSHLSSFEKQLTGTNVATEQANLRLGSLSKRWQKIGTIIEQKIVGTMEKLSPITSAVLNIFERLLSRLTPDTIEGFTAAVKVLALALSPIVYLIEGLLSVLLGVFNVLAKVGKLIGLIGAEVFSGGKLEFLQEASAIFSGTNEVGGSIDINLNDPGKAVKNIETIPKGVALNVGKNMGGS